MDGNLPAPVGWGAMKSPPRIPEEASRLAALRGYQILDTMPDPRLDELTSLAATICEVPIALISLVDEHRQWFKSRVGIEVEELDRETSFCGHAILGDDLFVVEDTSKDERFADNPLVTGELGIKFYTGMPLITPEGSAIGTLCVIDKTPRKLSDMQQQTLRVLAKQVIAQFELRRRSAQIDSEKYRMDQALEAAGTGYFEWDLRDGDDDNRRWSRGHEELWGYGPGEFDGSYEGFMGRIHPDDIPVVEAAMAEEARTGEFYSTEYRVIHPDGSEHWIEGRGKFYRNESGEVVCMRGVVFEVTERKRNDVALAGVRADLERAQKISHTGSWEYDTATEAIKWSDELYRIYGLGAQAEEITYERLIGLVHPEDRAEHDAYLAKMLKMKPGSRVEILEHRLIREDGKQVRVRVNSELEFDETDRVKRIFGTVRDITKERETEDLLRIKDFAIESTATGMCFTDLQGNLTDANAAALSIWGYDRLEELQGGRISHLSSGPEKLHEIRTAIQSQGYWAGEDLVRRRDGSRVMVESTSGMIKDESGRPIGMMATFVDITEKKASEAALREREEQLRLFVEHNPAAIAMFDHNMVYLQASDRWMKSHRLEQPPIIGRCHYDVFPEIGDKWRAVHQRGLAGISETCDEESWVRADGRVEWVRWEVRPWTRVDGTIGGILVFSEDITIRKAAEAAIYQSQRRLRELIDGIGPSIYVALLDSEGTILEVGNSGAQALGKSLEDLLGHRIDETEPWTCSGEAQQELRRRLEAAAAGESSHYEVRLFTASGEVLDLDFSIEPLRDESGDVGFMVVSAVNITERKAAEDKTRYQEGILQETGRIAKVGGWEFDPATGEGTWTEEVARIHDLEPTVKANATDSMTYYPGESRTRIEAAVQAAILEGKEYDLELEFLSAKGVRKWVRTIGRPVVEDGQVVRVRGSFQDVTERKQADERIQQLNRIYSVLSEVNQTIVREKDSAKMLEAACRIAVKQGGFLMAWIGLKDTPKAPLRIEAHAGASAETVGLIDAVINGNACVFTTCAAMRGEHGICNDIANDPTAEAWRDAALERGYQSLASLPLTVDGVAVGTFNLYAPEVDFFDEEEIQLLDELALDIGFALEVDRGKMERAQFGSLLEASLNEIFIFDADTLRFRFMNAGARANLGFVQEELAEFTPLDIMPEFTKPTFKDLLGPLLTGQKQELIFTTRHCRNDSSTYPVEVRLQMVEESGNRVCLAMVLDLSERMKSEAALRESEAKLSVAMTVANLGHWEYDIAQDLLTFNDHFYSIMRTTADREGGYSMSWSDYVQRFCHPEDGETLETATRKAINTTDAQFSENLETRLIRADQETGIFAVQLFVERNDAGRTVKIIGVNQDITERRNLEEEFRQSQKMEAVGQLAGGVAHDFNNILAAILMQAEIAHRALGDETKVGRMLVEIKQAAKQAADLTRQLLAFSRRQVMQLQELDLNEVVSNITRLLQRVLREEVKFEVKLSPAALITSADQGMLDQILMNLVVNAQDAMPHGGQLMIATSEMEITPTNRDLYHDAALGRYVVLRVSDTGGGIDPTHLSRIFEPFFTTKDESKGTGLGLSTVFGIVKQHGGTIRVESELGRGTTFEILFAEAESIAIASTSSEEEAAETVGSETILLVEDDPNLRVLTEMILSESGYHVLVAKSGPDALKVWAEKQDSVHLLLTDMVMPDGMTGRELGEQLLQQKADLKIIFTSGYSVALAGRELDLKPGQAFAQKPCAPDTLLSMIRELLDG